MNVQYLVIVCLFLVSCGHHTSEFLTPVQASHPQTQDWPTQQLTDSVTAMALQGKLTEKSTGEPVLFGTVALYVDDKLLTGTETDFDGNYKFHLNIPDSTQFAIEFGCLGLETLRIEGMMAHNGKAITVDAVLGPKDLRLEQMVFPRCGYPPIISADDFGSGRIFTSEEIRRSGVRN